MKQSLTIVRGFISWAMACARSLTRATLRSQDTVGIMLYRVSMPDETVETRRPWRGSPWAPIRGSSFLCIVCIIQQYLSSFAIRSRERACLSQSHEVKPLALWQKSKNEKYIDNCYTIGYNSNTWFGDVLYPLIYHAVSATNPIVC